MRHVEKALNKLQEQGNYLTEYISITNTEDTKGVAPIISFEIQSDPIGEVGLNGLQATDMLHYVKCLFESLNESYGSRENSLTITKLEEALHWQYARTRDRELRSVEGKNLK